MKTLHVDLGKEWRGGQHQALLLVKGLRSRGHTAEILPRRLIRRLPSGRNQQE